MLKDSWGGGEIPRTDEILVRVVEELGEEANGKYASLAVVEIPDETNLEWEIDETDGNEIIREKHRVWY
ncbi:MAG: hypothetical protein LC650_02460 [Actinobacteria bacterium]|nr:hypothetical protein [Actinomycetota bacterium]